MPGSYSYYKIRYNMNNPSASEYPSTNPTGINDSTVLSQTYSLVQTLASTYGTSRNPFRLYTVGFGPRISRTKCERGGVDLANNAVLRGHPEQCIHPVAVEPDHHRN